MRSVLQVFENLTPAVRPDEFADLVADAGLGRALRGGGAAEAKASHAPHDENDTRWRLLGPQPGAFEACPAHARHHKPYQKSPLARHRRSSFQAARSEGGVSLDSHS